jgi:hypothetical protein
MWPNATVRGPSIRAHVIAAPISAVGLAALKNAADVSEEAAELRAMAASGVIDMAVLNLTSEEGYRQARDAVTALAIYITSLAFPIPVLGLVAFGFALETLARCLSSPAGAFAGDWLLGLSWLANPAAWAGIVFLMLGRPRRAALFGELALLLAACALCPRMPCQYIWLAAMVYVLYAALRVPDRASSRNSRTFSRLRLPKLSAIFYPAIALPAVLGLVLLILGERGFIKSAPLLPEFDPNATRPEHSDERGAMDRQSKPADPENEPTNVVTTNVSTWLRTGRKSASLGRKPDPDRTYVRGWRSESGPRSHEPWSRGLGLPRERGGSPTSSHHAPPLPAASSHRWSTCRFGASAGNEVRRPPIQGVAMIPSEEQPIVALTRGLLPIVPWYVRWSGCVNNRWNESAVNALLAARDPSVVTDMWEAVLVDGNLAGSILAAIGNEMPWRHPRFIPQDECFVVMKMWWHGFADCMERERCMWAIEDLCGTKFPLSKLPELVDFTLWDLLSHLQRKPHAWDAEMI